MQDALSFPDWDNSMLTGTSIEEVETGGRNMHEFGLRMVDHKRTSPAHDVFTQLLRAHEAGELDADELVSTFIVLMLSAGEVANAISSGLLLLLSHPSHYEALKREPDLMIRCVEEVLRYESPFRLLPPRFSEKPLELDGLTIPAGELIVACPAAANRDPARFSNPENFEPTRDASGHLAFGHGVHTCPASRFARTEIEVGLRTFVERFDECELTVPAEQTRWRAGDFMRRLEELTVVLRSRSMRPQYRAAPTQPTMQPLLEVRQTVRDIFRTELKVDAVEDYDNFFDLGGDSMLALVVSHSISERLRTEFEIGDLYANQTVEKIVDALRNRSAVP